MEKWYLFHQIDVWKNGTELVEDEGDTASVEREGWMGGREGWMRGREGWMRVRLWRASIVTILKILVRLPLPSPAAAFFALADCDF